jgi:CRISPR-associated protein Cas1
LKRLLNTLYVSTQGAYLSKDGECVVVKIEDQEKTRIPVLALGGIVCFGNIGVSPFLMGFCAENDVAISYLTENGRFLASVRGRVSGNVLLRREQYRKADDLIFSAEIARSCVTGKIFNARTVLSRAMRDHPEKMDAQRIDEILLKLKVNLEMLKTESDLDRVRGIEGDSASQYFSVFDTLITNQKENFFFKERSRRPPKDNINALLSFLYTLLMVDCRSALECVGLDPAVGFLHRDRPGRPSLALDIMEEFRPVLADRLALSLVNLQQVDAKGFKKTESGAVEMSDDTRKSVIIAYQERKREELTHPFIEEKVMIGLLPHIQAQLMARYIRSDLDAYPPFIWR